jgi:hypothetical protein
MSKIQQEIRKLCDSGAGNVADLVDRIQALLTADGDVTKHLTEMDSMAIKMELDNAAMKIRNKTLADITLMYDSLFTYMVDLGKISLNYRVVDGYESIPGFHMATLNEITLHKNWMGLVHSTTAIVNGFVSGPSESQRVHYTLKTTHAAFTLLVQDHGIVIPAELKPLMLRYRNYF